ncbi:Thymidylate synthase, partial [Dipsacomyces acuminosporus]
LAEYSDSSSDDEAEDNTGSADVDMRLLHLVCTIAEDQSRRRGAIHRGTSCNSCRETPIHGIRYKCAQCPQYDLCEACEAHDVHKHHVLLKINVPLPSLMNPRIPLIRQLYPGSLSPKELPRDLRKELEATTHLYRVDLLSLYNVFCVLATVTEDGTEAITRETFYKCLGQFGGPHSILADRLFAFYDEDKDGVITFPEMARGYSIYNKGTFDEKAPRVFRAYDVDSDGKISRDDLRIMLEAFADTNRDLTRNIVRTMEEDVLEDPSKLLPGQPISAAFTAPIPADSPSGLDKEVSALRAEVLALRESSAARRVAMLPVRTREPSESGRAGSEADRIDGIGSDSGSSAASVAATTSATIGTDGDWPVMEALSQDAIRLMIDEIFAEAATTDPTCMNYEEFLRYLHRNSSLAIYLETNFEEQQYLQLIRDILTNGEKRGDRTGTGTIALFAPPQLRFSLADDVFPLLTTKRVFWRGVVEELLWFIRGETDANTLREKGVHIWDGNGSREFLDSRGLSHRREGDLGPVYGYQWRHFGAQYKDADTDYTGQGVDQLADVVRKIRENPTDRRIILSAWNPADMDKMALPPCHMFAQFFVSSPGTSEATLSCQMYQRSCDVGLGVPFNIASYALLTRLIAQVTGLKPGYFVHCMGDTHIYSNHVGALSTQIEREPRPFPKLCIKRTPERIDDFTIDDLELVGYHPYGKIHMDMAV